MIQMPKKVFWGADIALVFLIRPKGKSSCRGETYPQYCGHLGTPQMGIATGQPGREIQSIGHHLPTHPSLSLRPSSFTSCLIVCSSSSLTHCFRSSIFFPWELAMNISPSPPPLPRMLSMRLPIAIPPLPLPWFRIPPPWPCVSFTHSCAMHPVIFLLGRSGFVIRLSIGFLLLVLATLLGDRVAVAHQQLVGTTLRGDGHDGGLVAPRCTQFFGKVSVMAFVWIVRDINVLAILSFLSLPSPVDATYPSSMLIMASLLRLLILAPRFFNPCAFAVDAMLLFKPYVLYLLRCSGVRFGFSASMLLWISSSCCLFVIILAAWPLHTLSPFLAASCCHFIFAW